MNIAFFGTSDYCLPVLQSLKKSFNLKLIVTRPDRPVGRQKTLTPSATKVWGEQNNITVLTPESLKNETSDRDQILQTLDELQIDLIVVADFGLIIPQIIFNHPKFGTYNIHFSKLPQLRGPSPVQFTLLQNQDLAWITVFKLESPPELKIKMDSGPIIFQKSYEITPTDTTESLYTKLFNEISKEVPDFFSSLDLDLKNRLTPQDHRKATFCRFLTKDDGFIDWKILQKSINGENLSFADLPKIQQEALKLNEDHSGHDHCKNDDSAVNLIFAFFRAVSPWPGMWTVVNDKRMKILECHIDGDKLIIDTIQFEGKNPTKFSDIKNTL